MTEARITHYEVTNRRTGVVKSYKNGLAARRAANKADAAYGAICCTIRAIWSNEA